MLTLCAFQLLWGRIYTFYPPKATFIVAIIIFEVGSALCGAAPSSTSFIVGRAIAGLGSAGISNGAIIVMMALVPLEKRPMFQGLIGAVFGVASVVGPLLGGAFTQHVSWRWCFYLNLPFGGVSIAILILVLKIPPKPKEEPVPLAQQFRKLDPLGTICFLPSVVCLLLALQWGGTTYAWWNWRIILLLVLFGVLIVAFMAIQVFMPETATLPLRVLKMRTVAASFLYSTAAGSSMLVLAYYIPLFFQAIKNFSPLDSGYATIPFILSLVIGTILAGGLVQRIGYPAPFMILSTILASVGAGIISTWPVSVGSSKWIGYQFLFGFGLGIGMQGPMLCAQIVLAKRDGPIGVSLMMFGQNLGGAIFLAVAQSVFTDSLASQLTKIPEIHLSKKEIVELGATSIRSLVPENMLGVLLEGYRIAMRNVFYVAVALICTSLIGAVSVEWKSTKTGHRPGAGDTQATKDSEEKASA